jgi:hypothetical protein
MLKNVFIYCSHSKLGLFYTLLYSLHFQYRIVHKSVPHHYIFYNLVFVLLGVELRALHLLSRYSTT